MAVRSVILYPDARLKTAALPVDLSDLATGLRAIAADIADLQETMAAFPGCVGLAAPQIGRPVRLLAVNVTGHRKTKSCHGLVILINPEIITSTGSEVGREGCLSLPDLTANVRRATEVVVQGNTPDGQRQTLICDAFEARAMQHEIDHLDGILFLDRVESSRDIFPRKIYQQ